MPTFDVVQFATDSKEWAKGIQILLSLGMGGFFFTPRDKKAPKPEA